MPTTPTETIALNVEDFRRLGVRTNEFRLSVIRSAAARSAHTLAEQQLASPSEQVERQLSRVVTSAYRLMDPRQRSNPHQRAYVGRILPNTLHVAGKTRFSEEQFLAASALLLAGRPPGFTPESAFRVDGASSFQAGFDSVSDSDEDDDSSEELWRITLSDDDLLSASPLSRKFRRARHRLVGPWLAFAMGGLLIGSLLGVASIRRSVSFVLLESRSTNLQSKDPAEMAQPKLESGVSEVVKTSIDASAISVSTSIDSSIVGAQERESLDIEVLDAASSATESSELSDPMLASVDASASDDAMAPLDKVAGPSVHQEPAPPTAAPLSIGVMNPAVAPVIAGKGPVIASPGPTEIPTEAAAAIASPSMDNVPVNGLATDRSNSDVIVDLEKQLSSQSSSAAPGENDLASVANVGSLDRNNSLEIPMASDNAEIMQGDYLPDPFAGFDSFDQESEEPVTPMEGSESDLIGSESVVVESREAISVELDSRNADQSLADAYEQLQSVLNLPEEHDQYLSEGVQLFERVFANDSLEAAAQIHAAMQRSLPLASDFSLASVVNQNADTLKVCERLSKSYRRVMERDGMISMVDTSTEEAPLLGRYLCLMLRNWSDGLSFLDQASDPKIASVARQEISLIKQVDAVADLQKDWLSVALRWEKVAERLDGRVRDSVRLHAIDILNRVHDSSEGLERLEASRRIDAIEELLPPHLTVSNR
ncbi:hypothetical protein Pla22_06510 [Rubripirellula amarantea]|uniref:Uncharacterized protein n=1 Tax=Rubripirellula amarantea TaxID=2527999 RepID=A0A5C5WSG1_9BACT|nr:hypothetical protein [Rubripirellula amarantea]TWT53023.1 hypothetical protein Pla22_06510 [Rubripirellula amarantea]